MNAERSFFIFVLILTISIIVPSQLYKFELIMILTNFVSGIIPSIDRYGSATIFSGEAKSAWAAGWLLSPIMMLVFLRLTGGIPGKNINIKSTAYILTFLLAISLYATVYGLYDEKSLSDKYAGKLEVAFTNNIYAVYVYTVAVWTCFYISVGGIFYCLKVKLRR